MRLREELSVADFDTSLACTVWPALTIVETLVPHPAP